VQPVRAVRIKNLEKYGDVIPEQPDGVNIIENVVSTRRMRLLSAFGSFSWFLNKVRPHGAWDYKYHHGGQYEDFGNFNFGIVAATWGFSNCPRPPSSYSNFEFTEITVHY
jgi:hypothetical protein